MEELIICPRNQFIEKIEKFSIPEMQELLWKLEAKSREMQSEREITKATPEVDRLGYERPLREVTESIELRQRIQICRETLLKAKYRTAAQRGGDISPAEAENFSWGIKETEKSEVLLDSKTGRTYWVKIGGDAPVQEYERIKVVSCGEFRWFDQSALSIEQMPDENKGIPFTVPAKEREDKTIEINGPDLIKEAKAAEEKSGRLKLVKVTIKGEEEIEYFMLCSVKELENMDPNKLQSFLLTTYLSRAHQDMVRGSLEAGKCLYGGTIVKNENGDMEVRFYDSIINAVAKANLSMGTCMTTDKKVKGGYIEDILDGISGRMARKENIRRIGKKQKRNRTLIER